MGQRTITVIGGGASGMTAAIFAAREGARVTILEHQDRVGKKLLVTGNGRCNFSNRHMDASCYRSGDPDFPMEVIRRFPPEMTLPFFQDLGIVARERDGLYYPYSGQASAVLDVLRAELFRRGVRVVTGCKIRRIRAEKTGFFAETDGERYGSDRLILAAGSRAAPSTGSDGSGYELARSLGHTIIRPLPALVQLRCREPFFKQVAGVRAQGAVALYAGGKLLASDRGELQLTDYGISGIPVFQVSRFAARALDQGIRTEARLDFYPETDREGVLAMLRLRRAAAADCPLEAFFTGWLHKKLAALVLKLEGLQPGRLSGELTDGELERLTERIKAFPTEIAAVNSFEQAQTCCGGVKVQEVDPATMESRKKRGLYLAGEILDVDGICGGYNLQWAWSTGAIAGTHAAL